MNPFTDKLSKDNYDKILKELKEKRQRRDIIMDVVNDEEYINACFMEKNGKIYRSRIGNNVWNAYRYNWLSFRVLQHYDKYVDPLEIVVDLNLEIANKQMVREIDQIVPPIKIRDSLVSVKSLVEENLLLGATVSTIVSSITSASVIQPVEEQILRSIPQSYEDTFQKDMDRLIQDTNAIGVEMKSALAENRSDHSAMSTVIISDTLCNYARPRLMSRAKRVAFHLSNIKKKTVRKYHPVITKNKELVVISTGEDVYTLSRTRYDYLAKSYIGAKERRDQAIASLLIRDSYINEFFSFTIPEELDRDRILGNLGLTLLRADRKIVFSFSELDMMFGAKYSAMDLPSGEYFFRPKFGETFFRRMCYQLDYLLTFVPVSIIFYVEQHDLMDHWWESRISAYYRARLRVEDPKFKCYILQNSEGSVYYPVSYWQDLMISEIF